MWACSPTSSSLLGGEHPLDRARRQPVLEPEAELRVELAGGDVVVGRGLDPRRHPDQHPLAPLEQPLAALDLVEGVEDQVADAGAGGEEDLLVGLVVAVHVDAVGVEAGPAAPCAARRRRRRRPRAPPRRRAGRRRCRAAPCWRRGPRSRRGGARTPRRRRGRGRGCRPRRRGRPGCRALRRARRRRSRRSRGGRARLRGCRRDRPPSPRSGRSPATPPVRLPPSDGILTGARQTAQAKDAGSAACSARERPRTPACAVWRRQCFAEQAADRFDGFVDRRSPTDDSGPAAPLTTPSVTSVTPLSCRAPPGTVSSTPLTVSFTVSVSCAGGRGAWSSRLPTSRRPGRAAAGGRGG